MKKQVVLTAVAGLLTLASVAVLPAFAQDTGGTPFSSTKRSEQTWQHRGDRDQHGQSGSGYNRWGQYGSGYDQHGKDMYGKDSSKRYGSGYNRSDKGNYNYSSGYGYGSPTMSR